MHLQSMPFPNMISVGMLVHLFICTLINGVLLVAGLMTL